MNLIIASDPSGGIGYQNKLPWSNIQGDLPRFKNLTDNKVIVMGRNTWDSLPYKPLKNRLNIVVSSQKLQLPNGALCVNHIEHFNVYPNVWLIGGSQLIKTCWHKINTIHLTRTFARYTCDTYIDLIKLQHEFSLQYEEVNTDHTYEVWTRKYNATIS